MCPKFLRICLKVIAFMIKAIKFKHDFLLLIKNRSFTEDQQGLVKNIKANL